MAEILGGIQRGLGAALNAIYEIIPSYALAIILLTIAVRALLIPLTVKQVRSMTAMQKLAPEQKKIQAKYKELQKKATNRAELQALRLQMNQEVQGLFREHGVNPLGGCLPMLAQFPVYIGMFSIMRASITAIPAVALTLGTVLTPGGDASKTNIPATTFGEKEIKQTVCLPTKAPAVEGPPPTEIACQSPESNEHKKFTVGSFSTKAGEPLTTTGAWIATCRPGILPGASESASDDRIGFSCGSAVGTGHLPKDGKLFRDVTLDKAELVPGVHAGCSASQAGSKVRILECSNDAGDGGGGHAVPYYLLIFGIIVTQYYQGKQMLKRATGQAADTQRTMMKLMPPFIGFVSLSIPAGANLYFLVSNLWTIGQQHILLAHRDDALGTAESNGKISKADKAKAIRAEAVETPKETAARTNGGGKHPSSKKRKKKKKR